MLYVGTWDVGYGFPTAVFYIKEKVAVDGKKFLLLTDVPGLTRHEEIKSIPDMENCRKIVAAECSACGDTIYSPCGSIKINCNCGVSSIEGGVRRPSCSMGAKIVQLDMLSSF